MTLVLLLPAQKALPISGCTVMLMVLSLFKDNLYQLPPFLTLLSTTHTNTHTSTSHYLPLHFTLAIMWEFEHVSEHVVHQWWHC